MRLIYIIKSLLRVHFGRVILITTAIYFFASSLAIAQNRRTELWSGLDTEIPVTKNVRICAVKELRINLTEESIKSDVNDIGLSYRLFDFWKTTFYYRWKVREIDNQEGIYINSSFRHSIDDLNLGFRIRFDAKDLENDEANQFFRYKISFAYPLNNFIKPNLEADIFHNIKSGQFNAIRYRLGADFDFFRGQTLTIYIMHEEEINIRKPKITQVIGIYYQLSTTRIFPK